MKFNVAFQSAGRPDPVDQLVDMFDDWRAGLVGRPDAIQSDVRFELDFAAPATTVMRVTLLDWRGELIDAPISSLTVTHAPDSDGLSTIGPVVDTSDGTFAISLEHGAVTGTDRFVVTVNDSIRPVVLMPNPVLRLAAFGDLDGDGIVDLDDYTLFAECVTGPCEGTPCDPPPGDDDCCVFADVDGDGDVDLVDFAAFIIQFEPRGGE
jgi:hypothetical protein